MAVPCPLSDAGRCCYRPAMLTRRIRRRAAEAEQAVARLGAIQASVAALGDEDLLDLADIFRGLAPTPLWDMASAEMHRRDLRL